MTIVTKESEALLQRRRRKAIKAVALEAKRQVARFMGDAMFGRDDPRADLAAKHLLLEAYKLLEYGE